MQQIEFLEQQFLENPMREYAICLGILLFGFLLKNLLALFLSKQSFRFFRRFANNQYSEELVAMVRKPFAQLLTLIILYLAFDRLCFPDVWAFKPVEKIGVRWAIHTIWMVAMFVVCTKVLLRATDFFSIVLSRREGSTVSLELANFLKELIKVLLVILSVFMGLRFIFHVNITALIASLGIGGLAVALAAQDTLANLLGSFVIYLDKPFKAGDLIESGDIKGVIEHVGFRTTRIRTLEKSLLTVPNKKLIDSALNNITLSAARRVKFNICLTYHSKSTQIQHIIADIKEVLHAHDKISDDITVRFAEFDASSLNILVLYFVTSNDYETMITVREEVNINIMEIVEKHQCSFAYPTQTLYVNNQLQ